MKYKIWGGKNSNNIGIKYRDIHPSYLGYIDCLVCGNSDPGTSGLLSPFSDIEGLYFDNSDEPDDFVIQLNNDLERIFEKKGITFLRIEFENKDDYFNTLTALRKYADDNIKLYGTSREGHYDIVMSEETSDDEDNESGHDDSSKEE